MFFRYRILPSAPPLHHYHSGVPFSSIIFFHEDSFSCRLDSKNRCDNSTTTPSYIFGRESASSSFSFLPLQQIICNSSSDTLQIDASDLTLILLSHLSLSPSTISLSSTLLMQNEMLLLLQVKHP